MSNRIIHSLWIGPELSHLEQLTIRSFMDHGHIFQLWTYGPVHGLPVGTQVKDANKILDRDEVFQRELADPYGIGKHSYALFSDLFRYKLLYQQGGWWVDMDVTCLRYFDIKDGYFFRGHPIIPAVGNVMKAPKNAPVMKSAYEKTAALCNAHTEDWLAANRLLAEQISGHQLDQYIHHGYSAPDWWETIAPCIFRAKPFPDAWMFVHWMNEEWRKNGINKNALRDATALGQCCKRHGIPTVRYGIGGKARYYFRHCVRTLPQKLKIAFWQVFRWLLFWKDHD